MLEKYSSLLPSLSTLKPILNTIHEEIAKLGSATTSDEITDISTLVSKTIIDAQSIIDDYNDDVQAIKSTIGAMESDSEMREEEQKYFNEQSGATDATTGLTMNPQMADRIHSRFISVVWEQKLPTLLKALFHIEDILRKELEKVTMTDAISDRSNRNQSSANGHGNSGSKSDMTLSPSTHSSTPSSPSPKASKGPTLFTASAVIVNPDPDAQRASMAYIHLDHGSQATLISRDLASRLALAPIDKREMTISGINGGAMSRPCIYEIVNIDIMTDHGKYPIEAVVMEGSSVNTIHSQPLEEPDLSVIHATIGRIPRQFIQSNVINTDLLLGVGDTLNVLENSQTTTLPSGYRMIESSLGVIVVGSKRTRSQPSDPLVSTLSASISTTNPLELPHQVDHHSDKSSTSFQIVSDYSTHAIDNRSLSDSIDPGSSNQYPFPSPSVPVPTPPIGPREDSTVGTHCNNHPTSQPTIHPSIVHPNHSRLPISSRAESHPIIIPARGHEATSSEEDSNKSISSLAKEFKEPPVDRMTLTAQAPKKILQRNWLDP
ncbi:hypothetical protein DXG03_000948 [Asterophora parasitica]|uniref:Peptidase A2 domain-containing protein n=1 Tax=Asterophora parasitica TaxID=117018 RepID=A0A9P7K9S0_9AGAR|nr:hypothetical protein DXG03_000948 [Asterophora parasitica]